MYQDIPPARGFPFAVAAGSQRVGTPGSTAVVTTYP
jgi:hypothetical protein